MLKILAGSNPQKIEEEYTNLTKGKRVILTKFSTTILNNAPWYSLAIIFIDWPQDGGVK